MKIIRTAIALFLVLSFFVPTAVFADEADPPTEPVAAEEPSPTEEPATTEEPLEPIEESSIYDEFLEGITEESDLYPFRQLLEGISIEIVTDAEGNSTLVISLLNPELFDGNTISAETLEGLQAALTEKIEHYLTHQEGDPEDPPTEEPEVTPAEAPTEDPGEGTEEEPGDGTEEEPGDGTEEEPGDGTEEEPGDGTEEEPGDGTEEEPGDGTEEEPGDGTEEEPGDGTEEEPGDGTEEEPGDGTEEEPAAAQPEESVIEEFTIEILLGNGLTEEQMSYILQLAESEVGKLFVTEAFTSVKDAFFQAKVDLINAMNAYKTIRKTGSVEDVMAALEALAAARENKDLMELLKDEVELMKEGIKELLELDDTGSTGNGPKEENPSIMNKLESEGIGKGLIKEKKEKKVKSNNGKKG